ncbi:hypothetical protein [Nonomuraea sp. NPDC050310]|uniref:hypothetical protein n=1 Tax=Nonomuraea sp. NPDC050310 TaxID=3154935 RepID=UPI0033E1630B
MIHPFRNTLTCAVALAWGVVAVDVAIDVLHTKASLALTAATAAFTVCVALIWHARRLEDATLAHATRVEAATSEHAKVISAQVLTAERYFKLAIRADTMAKIDAAHLSGGTNGHDTGPFQAVGRGLG